MAGSLRKRIEREVKEADRRDSSLQSIPELVSLLSHIDQREIDQVAALGSGKGALCRAVADAFGARRAHAIDNDDQTLGHAAKRGLQTHNIDLEHEAIPFEEGEIDLILCMGLLEHLTWYDGLIDEINRVTNDQSYVVFGLPNLAGWTNRVSLVTGHQPRNVEFSKRKAFGILDAYGTESTVSHVHAPTVDAFEQFLIYNGLEPVRTVGFHPYQSSHLVALIDKLVSFRPSLCRRFGTIAMPR